MTGQSQMEMDPAEKRDSGLEASTLPHQINWCPTVWPVQRAGLPEIPVARPKPEKVAGECSEMEVLEDEMPAKLVLLVAQEVRLVLEKVEGCEHDVQGQTPQPL